MTVLDPIIAFIVAYKGRNIKLAQVVGCVDRPRKPVLRVLDRLAREGYLVEITDKPISPGMGENGPPRRNPTWRIVAEKRAELPSRSSKAAAHKNTNRDKIWKFIRTRSRFTGADVCRTCECTHKTVADYIRILEREGFVRVVGVDEKWKVWLRVKELPIKRPRFREKSAGEVSA